MRGSIQLELPWKMPSGGTEGKIINVRREAWYYVYNPLTDEMLMLDDSGIYYWQLRDTVNYTPHLFNNIRNARAVAHSQKAGRAEKYYWKV